MKYPMCMFDFKSMPQAAFVSVCLLSRACKNHQALFISFCLCGFLFRYRSLFIVVSFVFPCKAQFSKINSKVYFFIHYDIHLQYPHDP